jgi:hypothetical protein
VQSKDNDVRTIKFPMCQLKQAVGGVAAVAAWRPSGKDGE